MGDGDGGGGGHNTPQGGTGISAKDLRWPNPSEFSADLLMRMNTVLLYIDKILKSFAARIYQKTSIS